MSDPVSDPTPEPDAPVTPPKNLGSFPAGAPDVGTGIVSSPDCGDVVKLQVQVDAAGVITDARFKTYGCGSAIASSAYVTELLKGRTLAQADAVQRDEIMQELALPPVKVNCAILAEDAVKAAIADFRAKHQAAATPAGTEATA